MAANLRKNDVLWEMKNVKFHKVYPLDLSIAQQIPNVKYLIERYLTIKFDDRQVSIKTASQTLTEELRYIYIYMNIYCIARSNMLRKFERFLTEISTLKKYPVAKRKPGGAWDNKVDDLISILDNGIDLKCTDPTAIKQLQKQYGVKETQNEIKFYNDNCIPILPPGEQLQLCSKKWPSFTFGYWGKCERKMYCGSVEKNWLQSALQRRDRLEQEEVYREKREIRLKKEGKLMGRVPDDVLNDILQSSTNTTDNIQVRIPSKYTIHI